MVVIAIIAILLPAAARPGKSKIKARAATCSGNLKHFSPGLALVCRREQQFTGQ